ncbi:stretch-activated Ca2+-permeable channel component-domain-containing protein [Xylariaceae sp. FL0804]|nr:stretch-activated Ca2+-permeable channel component-domain-containing protein [Xylariaceae sp. FL0804]
MQLSPLQSRLAASVIASCLLLVFYLFLFSPRFALAAELDLPFSDSDLDASNLGADGAEDFFEAFEVRDSIYEPDFPLFDRSIVGRVSDGVTALTDDSPEKSNLEPDSTITYVFQASSVSGRSTHDLEDAPELQTNLSSSQESAQDGRTVLRERRSSNTLWISANTCDQPERISSSQTSVEPPQLTLYVSTSSDNTSPGPGQTGDQDIVVFNEGAVMYNTSLDRDVYLTISAPPVSTELFSDDIPYNFEIAASTDQYYYAYNDEMDPNLVWVDSDSSAAFLKTNDLTSSPDQVISTPPYVMFAQNQENVGINGIRNSYCGLSNWAQIRTLDDGSAGQMSVGLKKSLETNLTEQVFYISDLNASSQYSGILARTSDTTAQKKRDNGASGAAATVFKPTQFSTKQTDTEYAVPGNPETFPNAAALGQFYDEFTQGMYRNFEFALQQYPCQAEPIRQYSLVKNCDDCKTAYKNWLCSVAIPRCEDFSTPDQEGVYLQPRRVNTPFANGTLLPESIRANSTDNRARNSSRNPAIDTQVQPGPYKELLPCNDLCYDLIKSCPAAMGFGCPMPGAPYSFSTSYGLRTEGMNLSCNYPGAAHYPSAASTAAGSWMAIAALTATVIALAL